MIINIIFLLLILFCILIKRYNPIIIAFIILLPTSNLLTEENLFGFLGYEQILQLAIILLFYKNIFNFKSISKLHKLCIYLMFLFVLIFFYVSIKEYFYGFSEMEPSSFIKQFLKIVFEYFAILLLILSIKRKNINIYIFAFLTGALFISFSSIFPSLFGLEKDIAVSTGIERSTGINRGNSNSLGAFLAIAFGFTLFHIELKTFRYNYFLFFSSFVLIAGILSSGSRTSFAAITLLIVFFVLRNFSFKNSLFLFFFILSAFLSFHVLGDLVIERIFLLKWENINNISRVVGWGIYLKHFFQNSK